MQKIGVIHYNFPGFSFEGFLKYASETGYRYVELHAGDVWDSDITDPEHNAEQVRRQLDKFGLRVSALSAGNDFVQLDPDVVQAQVERMRRIAGLARILDEEAVVRSEGGQPKQSVPQEQWLDAMHHCFSRCLEWVDEVGAGIAVDNHGLITNDGDLLYSLIKKIGHPRIGVNLDTMNFRWYGNDIPTCDRFYTALAPHVLHTHMKDGFDSREHYRGAALGQGEIHLDHALQALNAAGYSGVYCAEYEGPEAAEGVGYRKCCEWLQQNVPEKAGA